MKSVLSVLKASVLAGTLMPSQVANAQTAYAVASPFNSQNLTGYQGPFLWDNTQAPSVRYQQVYRSSDFTRFVQGPVMINEISFDTGAGQINVSLANVQVDLSTTSAQPDRLSSTFSQNVGHDDAVAYSGSLQLKTTGFGGYEAHIFLQHPFYYDPGIGNLLLDVRNYQTIAPRILPVLFNSANDPGDSSSLAIAFNVNDSTAQLGTAALLTRFDGVTVPEPRSLLLWAVSIPMCLVLKVLRKKFAGVSPRFVTNRVRAGADSGASHPSSVPTINKSVLSGLGHKYDDVPCT